MSDAAIQKSNMRRLKYVITSLAEIADDVTLSRQEVRDGIIMQVFELRYLQRDMGGPLIMDSKS